MTGPSGLQFDKVESGSSMTCVMCKSNITDSYYHLNGRPICASCKAKADSQIADFKARGTSPGAMSKAVVYGIGAGIAGAFLYFAVYALTGWQTAIVAIAIGYMVGESMRKATGGVGGRRYQITAVALTYLSIATAYAAIFIRDISVDSQLSAEALERVLVRLPALPLLVIFKSGASGILTAIIIGVGLMQAWRMTAGAVFKISGPYKIGAAPRAAST